MTYIHVMFSLVLYYRHDDIDIIIIRENTEGEYSGLEHEVHTPFVYSPLSFFFLFPYCIHVISGCF
jgi:isocitrate dehydrogenase